VSRARHARSAGVIATVGAAALTLGCGLSESMSRADDEARCPDAAGDVVVFFDRSASVKVGERQRPAVDDLERLVESTLVCPGDRLRVFLVHARTRGKAYHAAASNDLALPAADGTRLRLAQEELRYEEERRLLHEEVVGQVTALVGSATLERGLTAWTDLLGTIEVASEAFADDENRGPRQIVYYSDMYESTTGPDRRDFDRRPPRTRQEAEEWAREDAELVLSEMNVVRERFHDVQVRVMLGDHGNRPAADVVKFYWLELFQLIGFSPENIRYN
jgi:hypothetical protein